MGCQVVHYLLFGLVPMGHFLFGLVIVMMRRVGQRSLVQLCHDGYHHLIVFERNTSNDDSVFRLASFRLAVGFRTQAIGLDCDLLNTFQSLSHATLF